MNNILSFFQESSERVEHFLDNRLINSSVFTAKLNEGMRYSLFAGGKRLRPALVYASYGLFSDDYDYLITDCASCEATIRGYGVNKVINIADFISQHPKKFIFKRKVKVTFHKPCHLKNADFLWKILDMCENVEYVEMKDYDFCCGFAGEFALKNNKLSRAIGIEKAKNIMQTKADYVLSLCPSCNIGLHQGFVANNNFKHPKIKNLVEFLALADEII